MILPPNLSNRDNWSVVLNVSFGCKHIKMFLGNTVGLILINVKQKTLQARSLYVVLSRETEVIKELQRHIKSGYVILSVSINGG